MARSSRPRRVLAISSGGGHWIQLQRLRPAFAEFDTAFVCVFPDYADDVAGHRFHTVADVTRRNMHMLLVLVPQLIGVLLKERPDVVVTTGALPGFVALAVAKLLGVRRKIWIDSIANCERLSSSGRQARHVADEWITQWEHLATPEGPRFLGSVL
jgi:UDP-N-acetylglucosamine:LPS N-acetylglucosamine transferase